MGASDGGSSPFLRFVVWSAVDPMGGAGPAARRDGEEPRQMSDDQGVHQHHTDTHDDDRVQDIDEKKCRDYLQHQNATKMTHDATTAKSLNFRRKFNDFLLFVDIIMYMSTLLYS